MQQLGAYLRLHVNQRIVNEPGTGVHSLRWKHHGVGGQACYVCFPAKVSLGPRGARLLFSICVASPCLSVFFFPLAPQCHSYLYANTCAPSHVPQWEMSAQEIGK